MILGKNISTVCNCIFRKKQSKKCDGDGHQNSNESDRFIFHRLFNHRLDPIFFLKSESNGIELSLSFLLRYTMQLGAINILQQCWIMIWSTCGTEHNCLPSTNPKKVQRVLLHDIFQEKFVSHLSLMKKKKWNFQFTCCQTLPA